MICPRDCNCLLCQIGEPVDHSTSSWLGRLDERDHPLAVDGSLGDGNRRKAAKRSSDQRQSPVRVSEASGLSLHANRMSGSLREMQRRRRGE